MRGAPWVMFVALAGCGSSVVLSDEAPPETPETPETPAPPPPTEPPGLCGEVAGEPFAVTTDGTELAIVYGDGSRRLLDPGFGQLPEGEPRLRLLLDEDRLIVLASIRRLQGGVAADGLISVFDPEGNLRTRIEQPGVELSGVATGADGSYIISRYGYAGGSDHAVVRGESVQALPVEVTPIAGAYAGDIVRAYVEGAPAFYDLVADVAYPLGGAQSSVSTIARGDAFVSLLPGTPPQLWVERATGTKVIELEAVDVDASTLQPVSGSPGYLVLQSHDTGRAWRVALEAGTLVALPLTPPGGGPPAEMSYCTPPPVVGTGGQVVMVGGADALVFHVFAPELSTWQALGQPVRGVETTHAFARDGTWVLQGVVGTFCPGPVGTGSQGLAGRSTQVVRPGVGSYALEGDVSVTIRPGGACVGYADIDGVQVLDLVTGETSGLSGTSIAFWP